MAPRNSNRRAVGKWGDAGPILPACDRSEAIEHYVVEKFKVGMCVRGYPRYGHHVWGELLFFVSHQSILTGPHFEEVLQYHSSS